jgi:hypothetical protein
LLTNIASLSDVSTSAIKRRASTVSLYSFDSVTDCRNLSPIFEAYSPRARQIDGSTIVRPRDSQQSILNLPEHQQAQQNSVKAEQDSSSTGDIIYNIVRRRVTLPNWGWFVTTDAGDGE